MKAYQLHLKGKNRAEHTFKTREQAQQHQQRLIRYIVDRINEGQLGFRGYLNEAKNLEIVEVEVQDKRRVFSVVEYGFRCSGVVRNFYDKDDADRYLKSLQEDSSRYYAIMESQINDDGKNYPSKRRDTRAS